MALSRPPFQNSIIDENGSIGLEWMNWLNSLWINAESISNSGITAKRPTQGLFIGRHYFDTTLGKPIWIKSVANGVAAWVTADGIPA